jgi:hypothetical protein
MRTRAKKFTTRSELFLVKPPFASIRNEMKDIRVPATREKKSLTVADDLVFVILKNGPVTFPTFFVTLIECQIH